MFANLTQSLRGLFLFSPSLISTYLLCQISSVKLPHIQYFVVVFCSIAKLLLNLNPMLRVSFHEYYFTSQCFAGASVLFSSQYWCNSSWIVGFFAQTCICTYVQSTFICLEIGTKNTEVQVVVFFLRLDFLRLSKAISSWVWVHVHYQFTADWSIRSESVSGFFNTIERYIQPGVHKPVDQWNSDIVNYIQLICI